MDRRSFSIRLASSPKRWARAALKAPREKPNRPMPMLATGAVSLATGLVGWEVGHDLGFGDTFCKLELFSAFRLSEYPNRPACRRSLSSAP